MFHIIAYWRDTWFQVYTTKTIPDHVMRRDPPDSYMFVPFANYYKPWSI